MNYTILDLQQGSDAWHQHRQSHWNASEAPAMIGISKYQTRSDLLKQRTTGIVPDVDDATSVLFANGHNFEAQAREWAEEMIGAPLLPITATAVIDGLPLSASYDGAAVDLGVIWEHKTMNEALAKSLDAGIIPDQYKPQMVQQMMVLGAKKCLFMASNGDKKTMRYAWYEYDPAKGAKLVAGWKQFVRDFDAYKPVEVIPAAVAAPTMALPALSIQVNGAITLTDNLAIFGEKLTAFIERLPKAPATDQDFADAEQAIKVLETAQEALERAESSALAQVATVDAMRRTVALYCDQARSTRLMLTKLVAARKEQIRVEIVYGGRAALADHLTMLHKRLGKAYIQLMPDNFAGVIKGLNTVESVRNAVDTELARCKILASAEADKIEINLTILAELADAHTFLFADLPQIVSKANDDFIALVKTRIAEHVAAEQKRLDADRDRIRQEELARIEREQKAVAAQIAAPAVLTEASVNVLDTGIPVPVTAPLIYREGLIRSFLATKHGSKKKHQEMTELLTEFCRFCDKFKM